MEDFIQSANEIIEHDHYFTLLSVDEHTVHTLQIERVELQSLWNDFKSQYSAVLRDALTSHQPQILTRAAATAAGVSIDEGPQILTPGAQSIKARYREVYKVYIRCLGNINSMIEMKQRPQPSSQIVVSDSPRDRMPRLKLPPCDIKPFRGNYTTWPTFRDMFTAVIRKHPDLSPVEQLYYLIDKTSGEALEIVTQAPLTNEGFELAWKNLVDRYENKRILVHIQLKALFNLSPIQRESSEKIKQLQRSINDCLNTLKTLDVQVESWDPIIVYLCSTHLPLETLSLWEQSIDCKSELPSWNELDQFLTSRFQTLESISDITGSTSKFRQNAKAHSNTPHKIKSFHTGVPNPKCVLCTGTHALKDCMNFLRMSIEEREKTVKEKRLCFNCLATSHSIRNCSSKFHCGSCRSRHNTLLHRPRTNTSRSEPHNIVVNQPSDSLQHSHQGPSVPVPHTQSFTTQCENINEPPALKRSILGTARINIIVGDSVVSARALIDPASEATFMSERLQRILKLRPEVSHTQVTGLNEVVSALSTKSCTLTIGSPLNPNIRIITKALIIKNLTGPLPSSSASSFVKSHWNDLLLADSDLTQNSRVDLLLGSNVYGKILRLGTRISPDGSLVAQRTVFGWIITGQIDYPETNPSVLAFFTSVELDRQLLKFWEIEEPPKAKKLTDSDKFCEQLYQSTTYRNEKGRYVVSLPFKPNIGRTTSLGYSRQSALSQFTRNEARLSKNTQQKAEYDAVLTEYLKLGHMDPVKVVASEPPNCSYYLPHHAVIKPSSTTTKLRVVFNASSPTSNGISLNDVLYPGPVLQSDLTILILKWRLFRFVFNADMEKMYRQILVNPQQTSFQRILFRESPNNQIQDFELKTVTFGVNCAPYLAIRTLLQLAEENNSIHPKASHILRSCMYVDDVLAGDHNVDDAIQSMEELVKVLKSAGFSLRKWTANDKRLLQNLPPEELLDSEFLNLTEKSITKTLGLRWNAGVDNFFFEPQVITDSATRTKREVLSEIAKLFDPAGWLAPKIIVAKMIMQQVWLDKTEWDEPLVPETLQRWRSFVQDYPALKFLKIPRWLQFHPQNQTELHGFSDASEKAYAAVLYLRSIDSHGNIHVNLLTAKTKVAPLVQKSIPKLELCGAELLSRLAAVISSQMDLSTYPLYLWTDSTIVLSWLKKPPFHWQTFVANRVASITENVGCANWNHVDSKDNPADLASRGLSAKDLIDAELWWKGPKWLSLSSSYWKSRIDVSTLETTLEAKGVKVHVTTTSQSDDILERFSSFSKALRVISFVFRFYRRIHPRTRTRLCYKNDPLKASEMQFVQDKLIMLAQKSHFGPEYLQLTVNEPIPKKSKLLSLNPFLDSNGIMRVNGRLTNSPILNYCERFPILLPYNSRFTKLLTEFIHRISLHGENSLMLRLIRMKFWVPKLKNLIKSVINSCKICVIMKHKNVQQLMAALPPERCVLNRPFCHTGVDFAGPFEIKNFNGRGCRISKGYVLVFVCFSTKAIHLEPTTDMSTPVFLAAFSRFFARRGCPSTMHSDNGTTFVGAAKILEREKRQFMQNVSQAVVSSVLPHCMEWKFIPPGAPHMGGLWEAGVKSFKAHLKKIAPTEKFTFEEFSTLLCRIEACLNSRPLSPMSENPSDPTALTPGHFLIGGPILSPPEPDFSNQPVSLLNRWQKVKRLHQNLAQRWKEEYLKELHRRYKWQFPERDVAVNDLVVVRQENLPSFQWRLGRVQRVYYGNDQRVRVVDILTQKGVITRPIVKIVILPSNTY